MHVLPCKRGNLIKAVLCLHTDEPGKARQDGRVRPDRRQGLSQEVGGLSNRSGMPIPIQRQDELDENNSSGGSGWQQHRYERHMQRQLDPVQHDMLGPWRALLRSVCRTLAELRDVCRMSDVPNRRWS